MFLPIVVNSKWDIEQISGLAYAIGVSSSDIHSFDASSKKKDKHQSEKKTILPDFKASVERGILSKCGKCKDGLKQAPVVLQLTREAEQKAKAESAVAMIGGHVSGTFLVVDGLKRGTTATLVVDGMAIRAVKSDVPQEEEMVTRFFTEGLNIVCVVFLGMIVDEIAKCWPNLATEKDARQIIRTKASAFVHQKDVITMKGMFRKKKSTSVKDISFRLLEGANPEIPVVAFKSITSHSGKIVRPGIRRILSGPFVYIGRDGVRVVRGDGYFRFVRANEQKKDWKVLAPKILEMANSED